MRPTHYIEKDGHPYYSNGEKFANWDYSKPHVVPSPSEFVEMPIPPIVEIGDYVPTAQEIERMKKAEEKRLKREMRNRMNGLNHLAGLLKV